jgi:tetratricopeptide (TPR) repeat protein
MEARLTSSIVRVLKRDGTTAGTGFVVNDAGLIATCAHVVDLTGAGPGDTVRVVFHATRGETKAKVETDWWRAPIAEDVAILRLEEALPERVKPLPLCSSKACTGHRFESFGYPQVGIYDESHAEGSILGRVRHPGGWQMLEFRSLQIAPGMSGAPVLDTVNERVVGMVSEFPASWDGERWVPGDSYGRHTDTSFATSTDTLQAVCSDLELIPIDRYEHLRRDYISPDSVFDRVRLDRFAGREWLMAKVDAFLQEEARGYFVLEAGAGLGKTTFLAHLVKAREYIHHFVELAPGPEGIDPTLRNLAAQLIRAWDLDPYLADHILPGGASRSDSLYALLTEVARKRDETRPDKKIVVVIDALDEAAAPQEKGNVLGLPPRLPEGVYFIVSQRPVDVRLNTTVKRHVFQLTADQPKNQEDMRTYLEAAATWQGVARELRAKDYTSEEFVETLLRKCQGVWIYLHYVVSEIERGERSPLDLEALPENVWQYYAQYLRRWRNQDAWDFEFRPLLGTLAAAQEALSLPRLCVLAGVPELPSFERLLGETWRPYLAVEESRNGPRYRLYHASLREFMEGDIDIKRLEVVEQNLARDLAEATCEAHSRIADRYLKVWGSLKEGLPRLRDEEGQKLRDLDNGYGLRYLAAHLKGANRATDLHRLVQLDWEYKVEVADSRPGLRGWLDRLRGKPCVHHQCWYENTWYTAKEAGGDIGGYIADVDRAWKLAEARDGDTDIGDVTGLRIEGLGLQLRYALITASINSLAQRIPPKLIIALVKKGVWDPAQGYAIASQVPDAGQRTEALLGLVAYMSKKDEAQTLRHAIAAARAIRDEMARAEALTELAPQLAGLRYPREALDTARAIRCKQLQVQTLAYLALLLAELGYLDDAQEAAQSILDSDDRGQALWELAARLVKLGYPDKALAVVRAIPDQDERVQALAKLVIQLPDPMREGILQEVLSAVRLIRWNKPRVMALVGLAQFLPEELLQDALAIAQDIRCPADKADAVVGIAPYLPEPLLQQALISVHRIIYPCERAEALARLAPNLPESQAASVLQEALATARAIEDAGDRKRALVRLASHLDDPLRSEILGEVQTLVHKLPKEDSWGRYRRTEDTVSPGRRPAKPPESMTSKEKALAVAEQIREPYYHHRPSYKLSELISQLSEAEQKEVLDVALTSARELKGNALSNALDDLMRFVPQLSKPFRAEVLRQVLGLALNNGLRRISQVIRKELALLLAELGRPNQALAAAHAITNAYLMIESLAEIAPCLPVSLRNDALQDAFAATRGLEDRERQAKLLSALAPELAEYGYPQQALAALTVINDRMRRAEVLTNLVPHLTQQQCREGLEKIRIIQDGALSAEVLVKLAPHLPGRLSQKALETVQELPEKYEWSQDRKLKALIELIPHLPVPLKEKRLEEALDTARVMPDIEVWAEAIARLSLLVSEPTKLLQEALEEAYAIKDPRAQATALAHLAPALAEVGDTEGALTAAKAIRIKDRRDKTLAQLASLFVELKQTEKALKVAQMIRDPSCRAELLVKIAPHLSVPEKEKALQEAVITLRIIRNDWEWARVMAIVAPDLPDLQLRRALTDAKAFGEELAESRPMAALVTHIATGSRNEAVAEAQPIQNMSGRIRALAESAPHLLELLLSDAVLATPSVQAADNTASAPTGLDPRISQLQLLDELAAVRWLSAGAVIDTSRRFEALAELSPRLVDLDIDDFSPAWNETLRILASRTRRDLLMDILALVQVIDRVGGPESVADTFQAIQDVERWWP